MEPYHDDLPAGVSVVNRRAYKKWYDDALNVSCLMLHNVPWAAETVWAYWCLHFYSGAA
jgi:hypothetical protein